MATLEPQRLPVGTSADEQKLLRLLFDAMPQLGWTALSDGYIDYYNRGWYEYTGTTYEEMKGWGWTNVHHPDELPRVLETWNRSIATGKPWNVAFPLRRYDGVFRWFLSRATPIHDETGKLIRWVGINTDIDDQKRAEAQLKELDRSKTEFFDNISHEFRTPLTLMLGPTADAVTARRPLDGEDLAAVYRNELRLLKLVNTLLDFSRIEAGRTQLSFEKVDIVEFTRDTASAFRSAIERAGLGFSVECDPIADVVYVDRNMWEKVLLNLLSNALKFTFKGTIRVRLTSTENQLVLEVRDTGTGISPEEMPHLFERFHRVKNAKARTYEGSGIGLALVKEIVRMHGGNIQAKSEVGHGTTFTVSIPLGMSHLPKDHIRAPARAASSMNSADPYVQEALRWFSESEANSPTERAPEAILGARILLADDNADMRDYLRRILSPRWNVEAVANGAAALSAARRLRPDLVLTDVMMPELDGFGLLRELRNDPILASVPIIIFSARAGEEARAAGIETGADDYLVKPFSARELIARITTHLEIARVREEAERTAQRERLAHERLEAVLRQMPVGVIMLERQLNGGSPKLLLVNERAMDIVRRTGDSPEELLKKWHPLRVTAFEGQEVQDEEIAFTNPKDSRFTAIRIHSILLKDNNRQLAVIALDDITATKEASKFVDQFIGILGHDLRTPLSAISMSAKLLIHRGGVDSVQHKMVDRILQSTGRMIQMVSDLLDLTRGRLGGGIPVNPSATNFTQLVGNMVTEFELAHPGRSIVCLVEQSVMGEWDPDRLSQVLSNLISNALQHGAQDKPVRVRLWSTSENAVLEIHNEGPPIPKDTLPFIFEPFRRKQTPSEGTKGLGLGLFITSEIVHAHGGTIRIASTIEEGTTFTVVLPRSSPQLNSRPT